MHRTRHARKQAICRCLATHGGGAGPRWTARRTFRFKASAPQDFREIRSLLCFFRRSTCLSSFGFLASPSPSSFCSCCSGCSEHCRLCFPESRSVYRAAFLWCTPYADLLCCARVCAPRQNQLRWRSASYRHTPLATDTLRLSTAPCMGMLTSSSQVLRVSWRMPSPSAPSTRATGPLRSTW